MGSIFYQGWGIKILGKKGLRDQNNDKKIGINGSRIYHVTTMYIVKLDNFDPNLEICTGFENNVDKN